LSLENHKQVIEDLTEEQIKEIKKAVPEQNLNFKEYIDYMNRSYATEQQNQEWTAVFNQDANYLQTKRVDQLKRNLEEAYQNGSLLWQGVISFDNEFL
ncbi:relaxase MobL, partial [Streptococcus anginosus]